MTPRTRILVATVAVLAALAGCSSSGSDSGGSAPEGADAVAGLSAQDDLAVSAGDTAREADGEDGQQVVQTAHAIMIAPDPVAAARQVVALVAQLDGRVDARYERSGAGEDDPGNATLTLRVPSKALAGFPDDLAEIGEVREFLVESENVTNAAQDLDARITATELSIERMSDLLSRASTTGDIIEAEGALTERQANLERLLSERARLADRVALSTVDVEVYPPDEVPASAQTGPRTFLDGLETGWTAFTATARGFLVVLGVLLPWLVLGGLVVTAVLTWRRRRGRTAPTTPRHTPTPPAPDGAPGGTSAAPPPGA